MAYAVLPADHQLEMAKERFLSSLGNLGLQRHLLGVATMKAAARASDEYLQLTVTHAGGRVCGAHTYQVTDETPLKRDVTPEDPVKSVRDDRMGPCKKYCRTWSGKWSGWASHRALALPGQLDQPLV